MSEDIDLKALEAAEKELADQLERDAKTPPPCPNCHSAKTRRELRVTSFVLVYSITVICVFWFLFINVLSAMLLILILSPALIIAIVMVLYPHNYCCYDCGIRFKGRILRRFI